MSEPFIGQIMMFGGNFAPRGWAKCDGQTLAIAEYEALFSLLGTIYGGDGRSTFGLPDLRGRAPIHEGQGPGLADHRLGSRGGSETTTLTTDQIPSHSHSLAASTQPPNTALPTDAALAPASGRGVLEYDNANAPSVALKSTSIGNTGSNQPVNNMMPYIAMNFVIALEGIYPSRS